MRPAAAAWLAWLALAGSIRASEVQVSQKSSNQRQCMGMYSRQAWGGDVDPFILATMQKVEVQGDSDPVVSMVIFEWKDETYVGAYPSDSAPDKTFICDGGSIDASLCTQAQLGQFIVSKNVNSSINPIITKAVHLKDPEAINYAVKKTGYYCVATYGFSAADYNGAVEFRNAYGELQAAQIAKLPFYGALTIVYAVLAIFWGFLYVPNRSDILPVQNYITAIILFLIVEHLFTWGYYDYTNVHGSNAFSKVLLIIVAILNAARNSFSFFLLLIVCMGYGVVKPSLGKTMWYVRALALVHFFFGVIYAVASLSITPENAGPLVLLVILPLAATLTAFYVWTLNSLNYTMKDLLQRKQSVKAAMYRKLWWCILGSIIVIFGFFFANSLTFAGRGDRDFVPRHWKTRWFVLDGWLNIVFFFDLAFIAYLWRPTANNRRFAMSDELAQDDEGFEIASFGGSLDDEEDAHSRDDHSLHADNGGLSPVPPKPVNESHPDRPSLDGETIFAVGEEGDKGSDEEGDEEERKKLTR